MAGLRETRPGNAPDSCKRLFDNAALGELIGKVQSAVISSGSELEATIANSVQNTADLDAFPEQGIMPEGVRPLPDRSPGSGETAGTR